MTATSEPDRLAEALEAFLTRPPGTRADPTRAGEFLDRHRHLHDLLEPMLARDDGPAPPPRAEIVPGARLGRFVLGDELGRGGMGVVHAAEDTDDGTRVAVKILPLLRAANPRARERFRREAAAARRLRHPGIARIIDAGETDGGVHWIAMELVEGRSLRDAWLDVLAACDGDGARVPPTVRLGRADGLAYPLEVARVGAGIAAALAHAHGHGVLHRDIKPQNVLIDTAGEPRLVDFGLAQDADTDPLTLTGDFAGTPQYSSPERLAGERDAIDGKSDVFSLGVTLYELLAMRRPFPGDAPAAILDAIRGGAAPRLGTHVPPAVATAVLRCLDPDPAERPDAATLATALTAAVAGRGATLRPLARSLRARRWVTRHRAAMLAVVVALLLLIGLPTGLALHFWRAEQAVAAEQVRTQRNYERARQAVEGLLHRIAAVELDDIPGMQELRRGLQRDAHALFEELRAERPDNLDIALLAATTGAAVGVAEFEIGRMAESMPWLDRAVTELEALAPRIDAARRDAFDATRAGRTADRGTARLAVRADVPGALADLDRAFALWTALTERTTTRAPLRDRARIEMARVATRYAEALRPYDRTRSSALIATARGHWSAAAAAVEESPAWLTERALTTVVAARVTTERGDAAAARALHAAALDDLDRAEALAQKPSARRAIVRAGAFASLADALWLDGDATAAEVARARADALYQDIVRDDPTAIAPRRARVHLALAAARTGLLRNDLPRARQFEQQASAEAAELVALCGTEPLSRTPELEALGLRAALQQAETPADRDAIEALLDRIRALHAELLRDGLGHPRDDVRLAGAIANHARWLFALVPDRDPPRALELLREADALLVGAMETIPDDTLARSYLWVTLRVRTATELSLRRRDDALATIERSVAAAATGEQLLQVLETLVRTDAHDRAAAMATALVGSGRLTARDLADRRLDPLRARPDFPKSDPGDRR